MQISSILDITNGELKNSPLISFITDIKIDPNKVKQGDLFLVKNKNDIPIAVQNGAFAIIYDDINIQLIDKEIAWIYVEDINYAMIRIMRYILSLHTLDIFLCDDATIELIKIYKSDFQHPVIILENDMYQNIIKLNQIEEFSIIFSTNQIFLQKIYPSYQQFNKPHYNIQNLIIHNAFETTFSYMDQFFSRLKLSKIYIYQFLDLYLYLNKDLDLNKLKLSKLFKPIFINLHIDIVEFGKSDRFIVAIKNKNLEIEQIDFINHTYSYAKIVIVNYEENLINKIKNLDFNILIIAGESYDKIYDILSLPKEEITLF
jgi:ferrochelatase